MIKTSAIVLGAFISTSLVAAPATAQERETPYWASINTAELNMRVGPGRDYKIEWVYERHGLPLKVLRVQEGWRFVQDPDGTEGWVTAALISADRTAYVIGDGLAPMRASPQDDAALRWNLEAGVIGDLGECEAGWCELSVEGRKGFVAQGRLWGAGEP